MVAVYLSETQAQAIAVKLRRHQSLGPVVAALRGIYAPGLRSLLQDPRKSRVRVVGEVEAEQFVGLPGLQLSSDWIETLLTRWLGLALASELERHRSRFVATADAPADGLTLTVRIDQVPGLAAVAQLMRKRLPSASSALTALRDLERFRPGSVTLRVTPGYQSA